MEHDENYNRMTLDHRETEDTLKECIDEECATIVAKWINKHGKDFVGNIEDILPSNIADKMKYENDLIFIYNKEYDKHRNEGNFGLHWFTLWIEKEAMKILNKNIMSKKKKTYMIETNEQELCDDWFNK